MDHAGYSQLRQEYHYSELERCMLSPTAVKFQPYVLSLDRSRQCAYITLQDYVTEISNDAGRTLMGSHQENWFYRQLKSSGERVVRKALAL